MSLQMKCSAKLKSCGSVRVVEAVGDVVALDRVQVDRALEAVEVRDPALAVRTVEVVDLEGKLKLFPCDFFPSPFTKAHVTYVQCQRCKESVNLSTGFHTPLLRLRLIPFLHRSSPIPPTQYDHPIIRFYNHIFWRWNLHNDKVKQ